MNFELILFESQTARGLSNKTPCLAHCTQSNQQFKAGDCGHRFMVLNCWNVLEPAQKYFTLQPERKFRKKYGIIKTVPARFSFHPFVYNTYLICKFEANASNWKFVVEIETEKPRRYSAKAVLINDKTNYRSLSSNSRLYSFTFFRLQNVFGIEFNEDAKKRFEYSEKF